MGDYVVEPKKEALQMLRMALDEVVISKGNFKYALAEGIVALEKQMPVMAILDICPVCEGDLKIWDDSEKYNYCPNCGQKVIYNK